MKKILVLVIICLVGYFVLVNYNNSQRFVVVEVKNSSMEPTIRKNAVVAIEKNTNNLKNGDIVAYSYPKTAYKSEDEYLIFMNDIYLGRIAEIKGKELTILSDNQDSIDSRKLGPIPYELVKGVYAKCIKRCE